jgi:hypothetical protein
MNGHMAPKTEDSASPFLGGSVIPGMAKLIPLAVATCLGGFLLAGCAMVPQVKREYLSDPIMQRQEDTLESGLESHDFPRREGSVGGSSGSGGGCGC